MICQVCHGSGKLTGQIGGAAHVYPQLPCDTCCGNGTDYCCDGADGYDAAADARGCYELAVREIGARVKAGAPVPPFFPPNKPETAE